MDRFMLSGPAGDAGSKGLNAVLIFVVVAASAVFPRLMVMGGLPATDEGFYAYQAQMIYQSLSSGHGLPDSGTLALYPMLVSWVFGLEVNALIALRFIDLIIAVIAAVLLYRVLKHESKSRIGAALLTSIFIFAANQPIFIQYGFKNSITVAFVPLLYAVLIAQKNRPGSDISWFAVGALTAVAVLLRETFLTFALLGFIAVWMRAGRQAVYRFCIGGILIVAGVFLAVGTLRGGVWDLLAAYREGGTVYATIASERYKHFIQSGTASAAQAQIALILSAVALGFLIIVALLRRDSALIRRALFWSAAASLPILEPATKIGFPYHFAVSLFGLAGLCALAWRHASNIRPVVGSTLLPGLIALLIVVYQGPLYNDMSRLWPDSNRALSILTHQSWPQDLVARSNYLTFADKITQFIPDGGTVSVSGFMFTLYPLTGHLPPSPDLANLNATLFIQGMSADRLTDALKTCRPDIIVTTTRTDWPGADEIVTAVKNTGLYEKIADVPVDTTLHYGTFGGSVYRLTASSDAQTPGEPCEQET